MEYQFDQDFARQLDAEDPLRRFRDAFHLPRRADGSPLIYFCGHSLGLQPKAARALIEQELDDWAKLGVEGHFKGKNPWYSYHEQFRDSGARLVGAKPGEVVMMNSLTVNLHLMLATFYRPAAERFKIVYDEPAFPSDLYALQSQLRHHGFDPEKGLIAMRPRPGEHVIHLEDIVSRLAEHGPQVALVLFNGVNFVTGHWFDIQAITQAAHQQGILAGFDLAHAAGNVPLSLHDWNVDFAVWCNYKYVNSGPGAVGGCFVHEKHGLNTSLPRLAGWWGNDPEKRFQMDTERQFVPEEGADGWQVSNPPIFSLAPVKAALDLFDEAGMAALRAKSEGLTGYLEFLLDRMGAKGLRIITPRDPRQRGCALSLSLPGYAGEILRELERQGVVCDFRPPNVIRVAPVPLYNTFEEVWRLADIINQALSTP
jgi:kynureninase